MDDFDPYVAWLDIGRHEHPISDRRLLGLRGDESNPQVISAAAAKVHTHLLQFAAGAHGKHCRRLTVEVATARDRLLAEIGAASTPRRSEWPIKPPPPVPNVSEIAHQPAKSPTPPAPGAGASASATINAVPHVPVRPAPSTGSGSAMVSASYVAPTITSGTSAAAGASPEVTPVGIPLGQHVPVIPEQHTSRVGESAASATDQEQSQPGLPIAHRVRRGSRKRQTYIWATLAIGGVCLLLLLIVLMIVARNS